MYGPITLSIWKRETGRAVTTVTRSVGVSAEREGGRETTQESSSRTDNRLCTPEQAPTEVVAHMTKKPSSLAKPPFAATRAHGPGSPGLVLIGAVAAAIAIGFVMAMQLVPMCGNRSDADRGLISTMCTALASDSPTPRSALRRDGHTPPPPPSLPLMDPWAHTTHPGMATEGWNWTQPSMSRRGNFKDGDVKRYTAEMVREQGAWWVWHTTFARRSSRGPGSWRVVLERLRGWGLADFRREWGHNEVVVAHSDHPHFNRGVMTPRTVGWSDIPTACAARLLSLWTWQPPARGRARLGAAVASRDLAEFGQPARPPWLEDLVRYTPQARTLGRQPT